MTRPINITITPGHPPARDALAILDAVRRVKQDWLWPLLSAEGRTRLLREHVPELTHLREVEVLPERVPEPEVEPA